MSIKQLNACWTSRLEGGGPFRGFPLEPPYHITPAKKDFRKERNYIESCRIPDGVFMHSLAKDFDTSDYAGDIAALKKKASQACALVHPPKMAVSTVTAPKKGHGQPVKVAPAKVNPVKVTTPAASKILALLSVPIAATALCVVLTMTKKEVNSVLYKLQNTGQASIVSGCGCGEEKGTPMWKAC